MQAAIASGMGRTALQKPFRVALCQVGWSTGAQNLRKTPPHLVRGAGNPRGAPELSRLTAPLAPKDVPAAGAPSQMLVTADKQANLAKARSLAVDAARKGGAKVVVLPECFNSPYGVKCFPSYAEHIPEGESTAALREIAREAGVVLVGGSIPEKDNAGKLYNTCLVLDGDGTGNRAATSVSADAVCGIGSGVGDGAG
ncbi:MAG: carbon-nitrogen hydrolase [Olpidium bornovanus]|uniref:Carbon-nitrogen hydrolase n=1 Tax=Olpidium bornovanus TaxID=278681 RepID=A0A8H8DM67_9FUNG|nr:MAG: carbon-nitrogen hydrolase [Olpidium bornovanus]